ncbi:MAG: Dyp-type peroxidase [Saprospiraceae bacterium]|nr:Dyp-type peroxidase [Lewinella sp.]
MTYPPNPDYFPANMFKSHGRNHMCCIFLKCREKKDALPSQGDVQAARDFIAWLIPKLTWHSDQLRQNEDYRRNNNDKHTLRCLFISHQGYEWLGIKEADIPTDGPRNSDDDQVDFFRWRMNSTLLRRRFEDYKLLQHIENEKYGTKKPAIDFMLLIANDHKEQLDQAVKEIETHPAVTGRTVVKEFFKEHGTKVFSESNSEKPIGPLGFVDDISNASKPEDIWNMVKYKEPFGVNRNYESYGSFFVFRKLEVNRSRFEELTDKLAEVLYEHNDLSIEECRRLAEAMYVGRYKNGTPLVSSQRPFPVPVDTHNNFDYEEDQLGLRCPVHAHIRSVNDRTDGKRTPPILRRGMTYTDNPNSRYASIKGLLFISYQSSIKFNLRPILDKMTKPSSIDALAYRDPINVPNTSKVEFPTKWGGEKKSTHEIGGRDLTKFKGGEIFFAPSRYFLEALQTEPIHISA